MRTVFLDTVGLIAVWEERDQWHAAATRAMLPLTAPSVRLVTTSFVFLECGNAASRKPYRSDVEALRGTLAANNRLIVPDESEVDQAWSEYRRGIAGDAGIAGHVSFLVMRRLGITDAFTNDRHFRTAGFKTLF